MAILGIDLGTTNSLVGVVDSGFPILLADGSGSRIVPSVVMIPESGEPVIGAPALRQRLVHPERTVTSVKRLMGKRYHECDPARVGYNFCPDAKGEEEVAEKWNFLSDPLPAGCGAVPLDYVENQAPLFLRLTAPPIEYYSLVKMEVLGDELVQDGRLHP